MWLYFNKQGQLITSLEHGEIARAGTTQFSIFAVFEGLDSSIPNIKAAIKLFKPDLYGSSYPVLIMDAAVKEFVLQTGEDANSVLPFKTSDSPYHGFYFDFANFNTSQDTEVLLDTDGLWTAVITLVSGDRTLNVQGVATFNVAQGIVSQDGTDIDIDTVLLQILQEVAKKLDIDSGIVVIQNTDIAPENLAEFENGQLFFSRDDKKLFELVITGEEPPYTYTLVSYSNFADLNIENGDGLYALQQIRDIESVNFTGRNPNAEAIDSSLSDTFETGASGEESIALNGNTMAMAKRSMANGNKTIAKGEESHAEGYQSVTLGDGSHAEGSRTTAYGSQSHSEGIETIAYGINSHSEGENTQARGINSHSEGYYTQAIGNSSHSEGSYGQTKGINSHSEGVSNFIGAKESGQPGSGGDVSPSQPETTPNAGDGSHAEGYDNFVYGYGSHAEGAQNVVEGNHAHAEGIKTTNKGEGSHTEGYLTETIGTYAHAEGQNTHASGYASHSQGNNTYAKGTCSFTGGQACEADANFATAIGLGLYTSEESSFVVGKYNESSNAIFVVGKGTDDEHRSNALEVYADGRVKIGANPINNMDLVPKKYLEDVISAIQRRAFTKVDITLYPTLASFLLSAGEEGIVYLYPIDTSDLTKGYKQYIYEDLSWLFIGDTNLDLTNYVTTNTDQTITGVKTFSSGLKVGAKSELKEVGANFVIAYDGANAFYIGSVYIQSNRTLIPAADGAYNLGLASGGRWKDLYLSRNISNGTVSFTVDSAYGTMFNNTNLFIGSASQLDYDELTIAIYDSDTTISLVAAPSGCLPEYKGILNSGNSSVTLTFTGVSNILCNDDNCVVVNGTNSTITLPANTTIEVSILNGKMVAINWAV